MFLSKNESSGGSEVLSERKQAEGIISSRVDSAHWNFIVDYPSGKTNGSISPGVSGFLSNGTDSFSLQVLLSAVNKKGRDSTVHDMLRMSFARGVSLVNTAHEELAALVFKAAMPYIGKKAENYTNDDLVIFSKEITPSARLAIASLFSIMIGIQGY